MRKDNNFTQYELDRDIPDGVWNDYLKKYRQKYKVFSGEEGIWSIKCKYGLIQPYSLKKGYLLFAGEFSSSNKKTYFLKKIPSSMEITQEGYSDCVIKFLEENLPLFINVFKVKKRVKLSEEERLRRSELMKGIISKRLNTN